MKIVGAGLSGLIGKKLTEVLSAKHELVRLKRRVSSGSSTAAGEVFWDPPKVEGWAGRLDSCVAVINLAGEPIADKRWTPRQKKGLIESRLKATKALVEAMALASIKPKVFINASAIGYYGVGGDEALTETAKPGSGFLADLCVEWERQARKAEALGIRTVLLRTGIVLAKEGGALAKTLPPFRFFLGGPLGDGRQVMSWIHIDDEIAAIMAALENDAMRGPINLTAPNPVTMKEFSNTLGHVLRRPAMLPVPGPIIKLLLGEMSDLLLTGQPLLPEKLQQILL